MAQSASATTGKSTTAAAASASDQPGRPYYENLRTTLRDAIRKKELIDAELAVIEDRIFREESSYLEDTAGAGNIVRGFDNWVKSVVVGARGDDRKARSTANRVRDEDRIFSRSSITWLKSQENPPPPSIAASSPGTGTQTPAVVAGPKSTALKNRKKSLAVLEKEEDDDAAAKPAKRAKISYAVATCDPTARSQLHAQSLARF